MSTSSTRRTWFRRRSDRSVCALAMAAVTADATYPSSTGERRVCQGLEAALELVLDAPPAAGREP